MAATYRKLEVAGLCRAVATSAIRDTRIRRDFPDRASESRRPIRGIMCLSRREEEAASQLAWRAYGCRMENATSLMISDGMGSAEILPRRTATCREAFPGSWEPCEAARNILKDDPPSQRHQLHQMIEVCAGREKKWA